MMKAALQNVGTIYMVSSVINETFFAKKYIIYDIKKSSTFDPAFRPLQKTLISVSFF